MQCHGDEYSVYQSARETTVKLSIRIERLALAFFAGSCLPVHHHHRLKCTACRCNTRLFLDYIPKHSAHIRFLRD